MFDKIVCHTVGTGKAHRQLKPFALVALFLLFGGAALAQWAAKKPSRIRHAAAALSFCLMFTLTPAAVFAAEAQNGLCKNHPAHTVSCGYRNAGPAHPCEHEHTADCYTDEQTGGLDETATETAAGSGAAGTTSGNSLPSPGEPKPEPVQPEGTEEVTVIAFDPLDETVLHQSVPAGTPKEELVLPETLSATAQTGEDESEPVVIQSVTWEPDAYYEGAAGSYVFTASAPGYACAQSVDWPVIHVTVEDEIDILCAAIDALPTVEELYENAPGDGDPEFDAWVSETIARLTEVPALWEQLSALSGDVAAMERITEARAEKLAALYNLAERLEEAQTQSDSVQAADFSALANAIANASSEDPNNPTVITVTGNITLTGMITPPADKCVKLTSGPGGPHTLTMAPSFSDSRGISVTGGCTLILENIVLDGNQADKPIVDVRSGHLVINEGAVLQNSGKCAVQIMVDNTGNARPATSVVMNDGEIRNNAAGGIDMNVTFMSGSVQQALSLTVNGGKITGNGAEDQRCGGIYAKEIVENATAQVTVAGGEISGNKAKTGGGIFVDCPFEMTAGTITGNTASKRGGGIYINENQQPSITGGRISGNTAAGDPSYPEKGQGDNVCTRSDLKLGGSVNIPDGLLLYGGASASPNEAVLLLSDGISNLVGIERSYRINPKPMVNMPVARMADGSAMPQDAFEKLLLKGMGQFSLVLDENGVARLGNAASGQPLIFYSTYGGNPVFDGTAPSQTGTGWAWDKNTKTLTLSGAKVTTSDEYALSLPPDAKIVLTAGTTSSFTKTGNFYTVFGNGALEITGQGKLVVNGEVTGISASGPLTLNRCEVETTGSANGGIYGYADVTITGCKLTATGGIVIENNGKLKISDTDATIAGTPYAAVTVMIPQGATLSDYIKLSDMPNGMKLQQGRDGNIYYATVAKTDGQEATVLNLARTILPHTHCVCGGNVTAGGHTHDAGVIWTAWKSADSLPYQTGNYYLTKDVTRSLYIPAGTAVSLCLNGHKITADADSPAVTLEHGATLNICDCDGSGGSYTVTNPVTNEEISIAGGLVTGGTASSLAGGGVDCKGSFNLYGGTLAGNNCTLTSGGGGGVFVYAGGVFHMYGGAIRANQAAYWGGGVSIYTEDMFTPLDKGRFYLHGGIISENQAPRGGGVSNEGVFLMDGGKIAGNTALEHGAGLWASRFELSGGEVTGNHAQRDKGCGVYMDGYLDGFILSGKPVITGNTAGNGNLARNLYFQNGQTVAVGGEGLAGGANIGVSTSMPIAYPYPINLTGTNSADYAAYFVSDDDGRLTENVQNNIVQLRAKSSDAQLSSLSYKAEDGQVTNVPHFASGVTAYNVALPYDTSPTAAVTLNGATSHRGASVTENNGVTLSGGCGTATITVTAEDGTSKTYTLNFTTAADTRSSEKQITAFTMENQVGNTVIDQNMHKITVTMPGGADVTSLTPAVTVSKKASVSPQSGAAQNFTNSVTYTVTAENGTTQDYSVFVRVQPAVATANLQDGTIGKAYSQTLTATGTAPITWSQESGDLPDGLTLNSDGVISGSPTAAGTFTFTVKATNSAGSAIRRLTIQIASTSGGDSSDSDNSGGDNGDSNSPGGDDGDNNSPGGDNGDNNPGSDNGDSGNSGAPTPPPVAAPSETKPAAPVTAPIEIRAESDGKGGAQVTVSESTVESAIRKAKEEAQRNGTQDNGIVVLVNVAANSQNLNSLTVNLPKVTQEQIIKNKVQTFILALERPDFTLSLSLESIQEINRQANADVQLTATRLTDTSGLSDEARAAVGSRPVFRLTATYMGGAGAITDFGGGNVTIAIPYDLQAGESAGGLCLVYIDGQGRTQFLTHSSYDAQNKVLLGSTNHFSLYAVGYKAPATFSDVKDHWAREDIEFVTVRGLMAGNGNGGFNPDGAITRGMFVTALGRLAGADPAGYKPGTFTDVKADAYYAPYAEWAEKTGVAGGTGGLFAPDRNVSRQEMAVIMANYAKAVGYKVPVNRKALVFSDHADIASWAAEAVMAMQQAGVLMGKNGNRFDPSGNVSRAQAAAVLHRYVELVIDRQTAQGLDINDSGSAMLYENGKLVRSASRTVGSTTYSFNGFGEAAKPRGQ